MLCTNAKSLSASDDLEGLDNTAVGRLVTAMLTGTLGTTMTNENNLNKLYELVKFWQIELDYLTDSASGATQCCINELKEALASLEKNSCDCTAGVGHIHLID